MGESKKLAKTVTLGQEPAPFNGVPTAGTACEWTNTPAKSGATQASATKIADITNAPAPPVVAPAPTAAPVPTKAPEVEDKMMRRFVA